MSKLDDYYDSVAYRLSKDACVNGYDHTVREIMSFLCETTEDGVRKLHQEISSHLEDVDRIRLAEWRRSR